MGHHVRTRLDELKRQEVSRLRMLLKAKLDSTNTQSESLFEETNDEALCAYKSALKLLSNVNACALPCSFP